MSLFQYSSKYCNMYKVTQVLQTIRIPILKTPRAYWVFSLISNQLKDISRVKHYWIPWIREQELSTCIRNIAVFGYISFSRDSASNFLRISVSSIEPYFTNPNCEVQKNTVYNGSTSMYTTAAIVLVCNSTTPVIHHFMASLYCMCALEPTNQRPAYISLCSPAT